MTGINCLQIRGRKRLLSTLMGENFHAFDSIDRLHRFDRRWTQRTNCTHSQRFICFATRLGKCDSNVSQKGQQIVGTTERLNSFYRRICGFLSMTRSVGHSFGQYLRHCLLLLLRLGSLNFLLLLHFLFQLLRRQTSKTRFGFEFLFLLRSRVM